MSSRKSKVKHPERYALGCFTLLVMYVFLVITLYRTKDVVDHMIKTQPINPQKLLDITPLDEEVPAINQSVLVEPDVSMVTEDTILVFVQSRRSNIDKRYLIRTTWGKPMTYGHMTNNVTLFVIFAIGSRQRDDSASTDIENEMSYNRDILLLNMSDEYDKLTLKGFLTMSWIHRTLPFVQFTIKTDDDIFLNPFGWIDMVNAARSMKVTCVIFGYVWIYPKVLRSGKYSVTKEQFKYDHYPSFCSGAAYMIPRDSMTSILEAASHIPLFLRDDPYFTGIVAQSMGIRLITLPTSTLRLSENGLDPIRKPFLVLHDTERSLWHWTWLKLLQKRTRQDPQSLVHLRTIRRKERGLQLTTLRLENVTLENECIASTLPPYFNIRI